MTEPRETILIVDDERLNINVLMELLSSNYDLMIAKNGKEALKRVAMDHPPDLILLDVMMPEMDGYEVIQRLKGDPATAPIPVIFVSALSAVGDEARGLALGAVDYITKPISPELVTLRVATHLRLKRQREELLAEIAVRKKAEEGLLLANKVIETTHEGIVITDPDGIIVAVNPAYEQIMGYARAEVVGRKASVSQSGRHDAAFYQEMWRRLVEDGCWVGEIWDRRKSGEVFPKLLSINAILDSEGRVVHYVGLFMDITHQKASEEHLERLAFHDPLTHLPNRALFRERLTHELVTSQRHGNSLALLFIDLDRFKLVNDTLGHDVGDDLLVEVAARLCGTVRQNDTVCRLGGDEFTVILPDVGGPHEAGRIADKIIRELTRVFPLRGHEVFIGASVGITLAPDDGHDFERLTKNADMAMYAAKEAGRGVHRFFTVTIQDPGGEN